MPKPFASNDGTTVNKKSQPPSTDVGFIGAMLDLEASS